jgi:hypothetical protein
MHSFKGTSYLGWFERVIRREVDRDHTPPAYGLSDGPMMVASQWNISSATGHVDIPTKACILVKRANRNSNLNLNFRQLCLRFFFQTVRHS